MVKAADETVRAEAAEQGRRKVGLARGSLQRGCVGNLIPGETIFQACDRPL